LTAFASVLFDVVFMSNLGTVAIRCYGMLVPADNLRDLCMEKCADIALLIDDS
jgi:hypothetical protein